MRFFPGLLAILLPVAVQADDWAGLPPDCWTKPRYYHELVRDDPWKKNVKISRVKAAKPKTGTFSTNKAYFFVKEGKGRPDAKIIVYAEKDHLIEIRLAELHGLSDVRWINEKLLYLRPWWGKAVATDLIYDVEKEMVVHSESVRDGALAFQQYRESCPQKGCECVKKRK